MNEESKPEESKPEVTSQPKPPGLVAALIAFQSRIHSIGKDRTVEVKTEKGRYEFKYATLASAWDEIRPHMWATGLGLMQFPTVDLQRKVVVVSTELVHVSGETRQAVIELPLVRADPQGIGAIISYGRRYGAFAILGLTQEDENEEAVLEQKTPASKMMAKPTQAPAAKSDAGTPVSEAEFEAHLRSCSSKGELSKVATRIKGAFEQGHIDGEVRERLVKTYQSCVEALGAKS